MTDFPFGGSCHTPPLLPRFPIGKSCEETAEDEMKALQDKLDVVEAENADMKTRLAQFTEESRAHQQKAADNTHALLEQVADLTRAIKTKNPSQHAMADPAILEQMNGKTTKAADAILAEMKDMKTFFEQLITSHVTDMESRLAEKIDSMIESKVCTGADWLEQFSEMKKSIEQEFATRADGFEASIMAKLDDLHVMRTEVSSSDKHAVLVGKKVELGKWFKYQKTKPFNDNIEGGPTEKEV